jgi:hypothetical protein
VDLQVLNFVIYRKASAGAALHRTVGQYAVTPKSFESFALPVFPTQVCLTLQTQYMINLIFLT